MLHCVLSILREWWEPCVNCSSALNIENNLTKSNLYEAPSITFTLKKIYYFAACELSVSSQVSIIIRTRSRYF